MIVSNMAQPNNMGSYTDSGNYEHGSYNQQNPHLMFNKSGSGRSGAGFTLLQGHIQLMAMVPNLPENQTSPRWKGYSQNNVNNQSANVYEPGILAMMIMFPNIIKHFKSLIQFFKSKPNHNLFHFTSSILE